MSWPRLLYNRCMVRWVWWGWLLGYLGVSSTAWAQLTDLREQARSLAHGELSLGAELGLYLGGEHDGQRVGVGASPLLAFRVRRAVLEFALPVAVVAEETFRNGRQRSVRTGNVWFGVSYLPDCQCGLSRLTVGVGAPSARAGSEREERALALARDLHGGWDSHLWRPDLLPVSAGYQTLLPLGQRGLFRLTGGGDAMVGIKGGGRHTDLGLQWRGAASVGRRLRGGARLSAAYWPTRDSARFQSAFSAFLRYQAPRSWLGLQFLMNLDRPQGPPFRADGVWSVQATWLSTL